jgi:hypothetical protein
MKRSFAPLAVGACLLTAWLAVPTAQPDVLHQIKTEALQKSQAAALFDHLVNNIGPRLTGSPQHKAAADWSRQTLASFGIQNARLEPFEFGRGWVLDGLVTEMVEPWYTPLIGYAEGWSAPTNGEVVGAPVFIGDKSATDVAALKPSLAGAIVLSQPMVTAFVREDRPQPTTSDAAVRIGAPPMPRQGNQNQAVSGTIALVVGVGKPGVDVRA